MAIGRDTTFTWLGHSAVEVRTPGDKVILFDPWLGNPKSPRTADSIDRCDVLLVTHGHGDHMGDAVSLAARLRPAWPCIHEMSLWLARRLPGGSDQVTGFNKGGTVEVAGLRVTMVPAEHSAGDWNASEETTLYLGRAGRVRRGARERLPDLPRGRHARVRRHGADPPAVQAGPGDAADRRPLHDGPCRGGARGGAARRRSTSCRSTGGRSRSSPGRRQQLQQAVAARGLSAQIHDWAPGDTID